MPALVYAPGRLPAGATRTSMVHVTDWLPTLLALAGAQAPEGIDGLDVWPTLLDDTSVRQDVVVNLNPVCACGKGWGGVGRGGVGGVCASGSGWAEME